MDSILTSLEPLHRPIEMPGGSVLLRELASAGHVTDATLSARATPLLHALTAAHAYILMFVHTCRVGQVHILFFLLFLIMIMYMRSSLCTHAVFISYSS